MLIEEDTTVLDGSVFPPNSPGTILQISQV